MPICQEVLICPAATVQPYGRTATLSAVHLQGNDDDLFKNGNLNPNKFEKSAKQSGKLSIKLRMQVRSCVNGHLICNCNITLRDYVLPAIILSAFSLRADNHHHTVCVSKQKFSFCCKLTVKAFFCALQPGYGHSYFFISSFVADHIEHHAKHLKPGSV